MPSPKLAPLILADDERAALEALARWRKTSQALALRAKIVLACADGVSVTAVAADLEVTRADEIFETLAAYLPTNQRLRKLVSMHSAVLARP